MGKVLNDNDPMGYMYISESFASDSAIQNIDSKKSSDIFYVTFDTNLQDFDVQNRNHRYYDAQNIMDCIKSEKIQSLLRTNGWCGEYDHPQPTKAGEKLSPERIQNVPPERECFIISSPRLEGNVLKAHIQSSQGQIGEKFAKDILAGWVPQFSCRAIASMISKAGKPYVQVKRLITYDGVKFPSHAIAHAISKPVATIKSITESVGVTMESATEVINDIMVPLKDILTDIGKTDVNTQMILESFDLSMDNMIGISNDRRHAIIRDENNIIYSNIDPTTVKKVNDFFTSF